MTSNPIAEHKTPITPQSAAFLFIDIQSEIVGNSRTNPEPQLLKGAVALAKLGRLLEIPMIASVVPQGAGEAAPAPELAAVLGDTPVLPRHTAGVFDDAETRRRIEALGCHDLVVCGVVSEVAVLLAAFGACAAGHEVHVPVDACGGYSARTEDAAFRRIESFGAATASVATLGAVLCPDLASPTGRKMMSISMEAMG